MPPLPSPHSSETRTNTWLKLSINILLAWTTWAMLTSQTLTPCLRAQPLSSVWRESRCSFMPMYRTTDKCEEHLSSIADRFNCRFCRQPPRPYAAMPLLWSVVVSLFLLHASTQLFLSNFVAGPLLWFLSGFQAKVFYFQSFLLWFREDKIPPGAWIVKYYWYTEWCRAS